jgi:hypothetical protein
MPKRAAIDAALLRLAPTIPPHERMAVVDHALSSRGLSTASSETAAWLSLVAYVRHTFTDYDELLAEGYDPDSARHFVAATAKWWRLAHRNILQRRSSSVAFRAKRMFSTPRSQYRICE